MYLSNIAEKFINMKNRKYILAIVFSSLFLNFLITYSLKQCIMIIMNKLNYEEKINDDYTIFHHELSFKCQPLIDREYIINYAKKNLNMYILDSDAKLSSENIRIIYEINDNELFLSVTRTGTHSDLLD
jgi:hypothetical protein